MQLVVLSPVNLYELLRDYIKIYIRRHHNIRDIFTLIFMILWQSTQQIFQNKPI
jgi:hypothetical protein